MSNTANKRGLKNRTPIGNAVDTKRYNNLKSLSQSTSIPMSKLLDQAIDLILEKYQFQEE